MISSETKLISSETKLISSETKLISRKQIKFNRNQTDLKRKMKSEVCFKLRLDLLVFKDFLKVTLRSLN